MSDSNKVSTVFLGSAANMQAMMNSGIYATMLADGIGLYGHGNGVYNMVATGQMQGLMNDLPASQRASGVAEFGMSFGFSTGTVTVTNSGSSSITVNTGSVFTGSNGENYAVVSLPGQPGYTSSMTGPNVNGYVSTPGGGYYSIGAGKSVTLTLEALSDDTGSNLGANSIVSMNNSPAGLSIASSSSFTGGGSFSENYFTGGTSAPFSYLYQKYGYSPQQGDVNVDDGHLWTANDLAAWKTYVDSARADGAINMAPILTANGLNADYSQDFATSPYWSTERQAALYGGGLAFDSPAGFFNQFTPSWFGSMGQPQSTYVNFVESQIKWANSEGLRSSVIIAPFGQSMTDTVEPDYLEQVKAMVARLQKDGAMPSQFVVENYNLDTKSNTFDTNTSNTESLNSVAEYLSSVSTVTTNSENGQEVIGGSAVDMLMTGIKPQVSVSPGTVAALYDTPQLFAQSPSDVITMSLTLVGGSGLRLVDSAGQLSADGQTLTATGTPAQLTAILNTLGLDDEALRSGSATLALKFTDASSTINGTTAISYTGYSETGYTSTDGGSLDMQDTTMNINVSAGSFTLTASGGSPTLSGTGHATLDGTYNTVADNLTSGVTLNGTASSVSVGNGDSLTMDSGSSAAVSLGDGAALDVEDGANATVVASQGSSSVVMNGGTMSYSAGTSGTGASILQNSGTSNIAFGAGQTALSLNMATSHASVTGYQASTGSITLTGLTSIGDVLTTYDDGQAIITQAGLSGSLAVKDSSGYGVSFSATAGSASVPLQTSSDSSGNPTYTSDAGLHRVTVENASLTANLGSGYTCLDQDMSANSHVDLSGFNISNGLVLLTHLNSLTDVNVSYQNGNAIITEAGRSGQMVIHNTNQVSFVASVGSTDFSQVAGSTSLAVLSTPTPGDITVDTGQSESFTATSGVRTVNVDGGSLAAILNDGSYTNINQDFSQGTSSVVDGFDTSNGKILATHLSSFDDLHVYYGDGNAVVAGENGSITLLNTAVGSVNLLKNVGSVNFSQDAGSNALAIIGSASTAGTMTVTSDQTYNAASSGNQVIHLASGNLTANLSDSTYTTLDIDMTSAAKLTLNDFHTSNGEILLKGVKSASDLQISYHDNNAYLSSGSGASIVLTGASHVSLLGSVGNVDFSAMTGQSTMALVC